MRLWVTLICPFYKRGNWGSEELNGRAGICVPVCLIPELNHLLHCAHEMQEVSTNCGPFSWGLRSCGVGMNECGNAGMTQPGEAAWEMWLSFAPGSPVGYYLQTVEEEALIKNNNTCKDFLIEAMKYHLLPLDQRLLIKNPRTKPRTPVSLPKVRPSPVTAKSQDRVLGKWPSTPASKSFLARGCPASWLCLPLRRWSLLVPLDLLVPLSSGVCLS